MSHRWNLQVKCRNGPKAGLLANLHRLASNCSMCIYKGRLIMVNLQWFITLFLTTNLAFGT